MSASILVTGAAGGAQGATGRHVTSLLLERGLPVRALVHTLDARSERLRELGAEVVQGDLLNPISVRNALKDIKRAYFTYSVTDGLLEATTIFAAEARKAGMELVVNNSQLQSTSDAPSFRNLQHRLADQIFDWANIGAVHLHAPPYYENVQALVKRSVSEQDTVFLPWGTGDAVFPLVGADDVAHVATAILASPGTPHQNAYDLVSETLTVNEIVNTLSTVLGRSIRYVEITDEQWIEAVKDRLNSHAVDHLSHLWKYFRTRGIRKGESGVRVTDAIHILTGKAPQTLEEFFRVNGLSASS